MSTKEHCNPDAVPAGERVALSSQSLTDCGVITENIADPFPQVHIQTRLVDNRQLLDCEGQ